MDRIETNTSCMICSLGFSQCWGFGDEISPDYLEPDPVSESSFSVKSAANSNSHVSNPPRSDTNRKFLILPISIEFYNLNVDKSGIDSDSSLFNPRDSDPTPESKILPNCFTN